MGLTIIARPPVVRAACRPAALRRAPLRGRFHLIVRALALLGLVCGCRTGPAQRAAVVFFIDGLDREVLDRELAAGRLPVIEREFVLAGRRAAAVASLPSVTYLNTASLLTGVWPARHGIYGNAWFDPAAGHGADYGSAGTFRAINRDLAAATIFERLIGWRTVSVRSHTRRGAQRVIDDDLLNGIAWWRGRFEEVDARSGRAAARAVTQAAGALVPRPLFLLVYFPGVDEVAHAHGVASERYAAALRTADEAIGRVLAALAASGQLDNATLALVTDHGHAEGVEHRFDAVAWLRARGLVVATRAADGRRALQRSDALVVRGAGRVATIFLRAPDPARGALNAVTLVRGANGAPGLLDEPAVGLVAWREAHAIRLAGHRADGWIERRVVRASPQYRWRPSGGIADAPAIPPGLADRWLDSEAWLAATFDSPLPDLVPQLAEYFRSPRSGDLLIFAAERAAFEPEPHAGHGAPWPTEARVATFWRGPGIPADGERVAPLRLVDVTPTLLDLLGVDPGEADFDGVSRAARLRAPR